jgi:prolyl-tRNA synthetase
VRVKLDENVHTGFGRRATDWELKGVPLRIDVGPRDLQEGNVTLVRRDEQSSTPVPIGDVVKLVAPMLEQIQQQMLRQNIEFRENSTTDVDSIDDAAEAAQSGVARIPWKTLGPEGEQTLLSRAVSVRCLQRADGSLPDSSGEQDLYAIAARAY